MQQIRYLLACYGKCSPAIWSPLNYLNIFLVLICQNAWILPFCSQYKITNLRIKDMTNRELFQKLKMESNIY